MLTAADVRTILDPVLAAFARPGLRLDLEKPEDRAGWVVRATQQTDDGRRLNGAILVPFALPEHGIARHVRFQLRLKLDAIDRVARHEAEPDDPGRAAR